MNEKAAAKRSCPPGRTGMGAPQLRRMTRKTANQPKSQRISDVKEMFSQTRDHAKRAKSKGMNWAPCSALAR
jgi:hypothetical protein